MYDMCINVPILHTYDLPSNTRNKMLALFSIHLGTCHSLDGSHQQWRYVTLDEQLNSINYRSFKHSQMAYVYTSDKPMAVGGSMPCTVILSFPSIVSVYGNIIGHYLHWFSHGHRIFWEK
jgi:hypothetical protein